MLMILAIALALVALLELWILARFGARIVDLEDRSALIARMLDGHARILTGRKGVAVLGPELDEATPDEDVVHRTQIEHYIQNEQGERVLDRVISWDEPGADIIGDIEAWKKEVREGTTRGIVAGPLDPRFSFERWANPLGPTAEQLRKAGAEVHDEPEIPTLDGILTAAKLRHDFTKNSSYPGPSCARCGLTLDRLIVSTEVPPCREKEPPVDECEISGTFPASKP